MWRSRARALILRSSIPLKFPPHPIPSLLKSPSLISHSPPTSTKWPPLISAGFLNSKLFSSSANEFSQDDDEASHPTLGFGKGPAFSHREAGASSVELGESDASPVAFCSGAEDPIHGVDSPGDSFYVGAKDENEASLWEEGISGDVSVGSEEFEEEAAAEIPNVNVDQVESVLSILQSTLPQEIGSSLDTLQELLLSEEFVVRVFQDAHVSGENLVAFFRWSMRKEAAVKSSRVLGLLVDNISASEELGKMEAYKLWDLIKEVAEMEEIVNTEMLNQLISVFCILGKAKACLEVFNKFDDFGCAPDGNTYHFTIQALGKKSMIDTAWSVCEKMLNSGSLPDAEKIGEIITFFCKRNKAKEAHLVYLLAKENSILLDRDALDFLIAGLCRNDETVRVALDLLDDYPQKFLRKANRTFSLVVKSLNRIKDVQAAKELLLRMVDSGPPPGNSAFNPVITGLCKEGEVEGAIALTKVMESRGLRPDVYTYSVIMSGFAKAGLMDEAFEIFSEAKKKHKILIPVTYHILIRGYCKIEEYKKALECLKDMKEHGVQPNADEYDKLIKTLCLKALDWRTAEKLLEDMKENGLHLNGATSSLIAAVKMLEEEVIATDEVKIEA